MGGPLAEDPFEPFDGEDEPSDCAEAAAALIQCHEGCVRSSIAGTSVEQQLWDLVDQAFRTTASKLLSRATSVPDVLLGESKVAGCLRYSRDRICVPRDMSYPAARQ